MRAEDERKKSKRKKLFNQREGGSRIKNRTEQSFIKNKATSTKKVKSVDAAGRKNLREMREEVCDGLQNTEKLIIQTALLLKTNGNLDFH